MHASSATCISLRRIETTQPALSWILTLSLCQIRIHFLAFALASWPEIDRSAILFFLPRATLTHTYTCRFPVVHTHHTYDTYLFLYGCCMRGIFIASKQLAVAVFANCLGTLCTTPVSAVYRNKIALSVSRRLVIHTYRNPYVVLMCVLLIFPLD
jgi:hypothetical protein